MFKTLSGALKVSIIALLALTARVSAETGSALNTRLETELAAAHYVPSCAWKLSCTFAATPANTELIQLDDVYYLVNQSRYWWGLNMEPTNMLTNNKVCTLKVENNTYTYTARKGELPVTWTMNEQNTVSSPRPSGKDLNVTIECDGENTKITLTYGISPITDIFELPGTALNVSKIRFNEQAAVYNYSLIIEENNPYPARIAILIGGLALLALIGIGIGRCRKTTANS